jgi:hypothetical protein
LETPAIAVGPLLFKVRNFHFSPRETSDSSSNGTPVWSFEIRVVHGSDEIHSLIRKSALRGQPEKTTPLETITNGVWAITIKSILESEQDFLLRVYPFLCFVKE